MTALKKFLSKLWGWRSSQLVHPMEEADALVLKCYPTGTVRNGRLKAFLLLQVTPKHGRNYIVECEYYFSRQELLCIDPGNRIVIYFPPNQPMKIHWVRAPGTMSTLTSVR
jgi:hypothetical protein